MIPLKVAATSVKLAMPPPITRALFRPSGSAVAHWKEIKRLLLHHCKHYCSISKLNRYIKNEVVHKNELHQSQLGRIAKPPLHWVHRCIQHSFQARMQSQDRLPDLIVSTKDITSCCGYGY